MPVMTGLSGNEIYCLHLKGLLPGELVVGNSVYSLGFVGGLGASIRNMMGGEVTQVTQIIHDGRAQALQRMLKEARDHGGVGITGVSSELRHFHGNIEFLSVGSTLHRKQSTGKETLEFSTAHDAQALYCLLDAGYTPKQFAFGNVAYSIGITGGILGSLKSMGRGEVKEFSGIFNQTRHIALQRIGADAAQHGANSVIGIETSVLPFQGVQEMMMIGTACHHPSLPPAAAGGTALVTSDLTAEETWNLAAMGFAPLKLVLGTAVYSLGLVGGFMAALKSFARGEVNELTSLIYDAREHAIGLIRDEANAIGADDVVGIETHIHEMGSLLEFMAIGTAVKRLPNIAPQSALLPPQAIIRDKDTWVTNDAGHFATLQKKD